MQGTPHTGLRNCKKIPFEKSVILHISSMSWAEVQPTLPINSKAHFKQCYKYTGNWPWLVENPEFARNLF